MKIQGGRQMKKLIAVMLIAATGCAQVGQLGEGVSAMPGTAQQEPVGHADQREEDAGRTVVILAVAIGIVLLAASMARSATKDILRPR
jgi:hypothetical protein